MTHDDAPHLCDRCRAGTCFGCVGQAWCKVAGAPALCKCTRCGGGLKR